MPGKVLTHQTYPPKTIYIYFSNIIKGLHRNAWDGIIVNGQNNQDNFEAHQLEYYRTIILHRTSILT